MLLIWPKETTNQIKSILIPWIGTCDYQLPVAHGEHNKELSVTVFNILQYIAMTLNTVTESVEDRPRMREIGSSGVQFPVESS